MRGLVELGQDKVVEWPVGFPEKSSGAGLHLQ